MVLALPMSISISRQVLSGISGKELIPVLGRTGKSQMVFSILLAIGLGRHEEHVKAHPISTGLWFND